MLNSKGSLSMNQRNFTIKLPLTALKAVVLEYYLHTHFFNHPILFLMKTQLF